MKHLVRVGGLLAVVLVAVLFVPRILPNIVPVTNPLANYGFHTVDARKNEQRWAGVPLQYVGSSLCSTCHKAQTTLWSKSSHRTIACENCHGPAIDHLKTGARPIVDRSREFCGTCHAKLVSRPASFPQVNMNEMGGQAACVTCHSPHDPRAGMPPKVPHELDDRTNCQSCHAPHEPLKVLPPPIPHTLEGRTECLSCHGSNELRGATLPRIPHTLEGRSECLLCHNSGGIKPFPADHAGRTSATCTNCHRSK